MTAGATIRVSCFVAVMRISFTLGFGTAPGRISAATLTVARVNPGPASLNGYITCLWHGTSSPCGTAGDLQALDWSNSSAVHFRTWAFRGAGTGTACYATRSINNSACLRVRVRLEYPIGTWRGDEFYTHVALWHGRLYLCDHRQHFLPVHFPHDRHVSCTVPQRRPEHLHVQRDPPASGSRWRFSKHRNVLRHRELKRNIRELSLAARVVLVQLTGPPARCESALRSPAVWLVHARSRAAGYTPGPLAGQNAADAASSGRPNAM